MLIDLKKYSTWFFVAAIVVVLIGSINLLSNIFSPGKKPQADTGVQLEMLHQQQEQLKQVQLKLIELSNKVDEKIKLDLFADSLLTDRFYWQVKRDSILLKDATKTKNEKSLRIDSWGNDSLRRYFSSL